MSPQAPACPPPSFRCFFLSHVLTAPACRSPDPRCAHVSAAACCGGSGQLVIAGGRDHFGKTLTDVWVLALESGAWGRLPSVGEGLRGMSMCDLIAPQQPRGDAAASCLLVVGGVSLKEGREGTEKPRPFSQREDVRASRGGVIAKSEAPITPCMSQGSMSSMGAGEGRQCLALCSLEQQVREKGSMSPRTLALGHPLWSPASPRSPRSALESAISTRAVSTPRMSGAGQPTHRLLNFDKAEGGSEASSRVDMPIDCLGSPWSRGKRHEERQLELAREVARESDDVTRAVPLDSRQHLRDWEALIGKVDLLVAQLASAGSAGHADADGNPTSLQDYARLVHRQLTALRDEAETRVRETRGIVLLAESPLTDILAAESAGHSGSSSWSLSSAQVGAAGAAGGDAVLRRQLQVLQVKVQADKRRLLASEIEMLKLFSSCLSEIVQGQRAVRSAPCASFFFCPLHAALFSLPLSDPTPLLSALS